MTVFLALLVESYRQLNAKKLFWITVTLSGGVMLSYASIGFDDEGMSMFFGLWSIESEHIRAGSPMARMLYRGVFSSFVVELWLAWIATILALISTTTIFPDFLAGGAVDMVLSKPIGRVRLFLFKYLASLLFVVLQVSVFCVGVFIAMGVRIGDWNWIIFAAIPLVTLFFSYFYCINVLVGVVTRSSLTALLASLLFFGTMFSLNTTEGVITRFKTQFEIQAEEEDEIIALLRQRVDQVPEGERGATARERLEIDIATAEKQRDDQLTARDRILPWHRGLRTVQEILPKSTETIMLLDRWLKEETDVNMLDLMRGNISVDRDGNFIPARHWQGREVEQRMLAEAESRPVWYVIGSSLVFEAVVLGLACVVFVRRDY